MNLAALLFGDPAVSRFPLDSYDAQLGYIILSPYPHQQDTSELGERVKTGLRKDSGTLMADFPGYRELCENAADAYIKAAIMRYDARETMKQTALTPQERAELDKQNVEDFKERISFIAYQHENKIRHYFMGPEGRCLKDRLVGNNTGNNALDPLRVMGRVIKQSMRDFAETYPGDIVYVPQNYLFYTRQFFERTGWDAATLRAIDPTCAPPEVTTDAEEILTAPRFHLR